MNILTLCITMYINTIRNEFCDLTGETEFCNNVKEDELQPLIKEHLQRCHLRRDKLEISISKYLIEILRIKRFKGLTDAQATAWNKEIEDLEDTVKNLQARLNSVCEEIVNLECNWW